MLPWKTNRHNSIISCGKLTANPMLHSQRTNFNSFQLFRPQRRTNSWSHEQKHLLIGEIILHANKLQICKRSMEIELHKSAMQIIYDDFALRMVVLNFIVFWFWKLSGPVLAIRNTSSIAKSNRLHQSQSISFVFIKRQWSPKNCIAIR